MTLKELAYDAQQHLQINTGGSFKRAHVYELLAASFGFNSYAAFGDDTVFMVLRQNDKRMLPQSASITRRSIALGFQADQSVLIAAALGSFLAQRQIGVASISSLISYLQSEMPYFDDCPAGDAYSVYGDDDDDAIDFADDSGFGQILGGSLEAAAGRRNAQAHYALALINDPDNEDDESDAGSSYWYAQGRQGRVLTGVEKEWAKAFEIGLSRTEKYARHLREAGRLGNLDALLDLAERFDDPSFFEQSRGDVGADPAEVAAIAARLGRSADAKKWLTIAAESGDTGAMLELIEKHDHDDLPRCWVWVYLSQLVGTDLTKGEYCAIDDGGSDYDDDEGGPVYAVGRDGVNLEPISTEQGIAAKLAARELFERIQAMVR